MREDGMQMLKEVYEMSRREGIMLLCTSSLDDAAEFLRTEQELFLAKTQRVTIVGTVKPFASTEDDGKFLELDGAPGGEAQLGTAGSATARQFFYRRCQELSVPTTTLSTATARKCSVRRRIFSVAKYLR
jgi:hypothetical protein